MKQRFLFCLVFLFIYINTFSAETVQADSTKRTVVTITPGEKQQLIEGWGGSLCWWANVMGGYSDDKIKQICNWITDPVSGLNMNLFRFNIGGGDVPGHTHMRADGGNMPGYKDSASAPYKWTNDANQRKILQQLIASRIANTGVNDVKVIGFSNSPPWWMTVSGCAAGSEDGTVTNLRADMYDDFADYLTDVTRYYHDSLGISFNNLEPFNEPFSNWWKAKNGQEGCYFSQDDQHYMIRELYASLWQKKMLSYCTISAMDANSIDEATDGIIGYRKTGDILPKISRIDVHSYNGTKRAELAALARENKLDIWQSESGPLYIAGSDRSQLMTMCNRIITDFNEMNCKAWIDWQLASDGSELWGLLVGKYSDSTHPVSLGISFYLRAQYSRYLKVGYRIIANNTPNVLTALSPDEKELVIVLSNSENRKQKYSFDLSSFTSIKSVKQVLTRAQRAFNCLNATTTVTVPGKVLDYDALPESVTTFIIALK